MVEWLRRSPAKRLYESSNLSDASMKELSFDDIMRWREAFASCAIEGNQLAIYMMGLWETDRNRFLIELMEFVEKDSDE